MEVHNVHAPFGPIIQKVKPCSIGINVYIRLLLLSFKWLLPNHDLVSEMCVFKFANDSDLLVSFVKSIVVVAYICMHIP